MNNCEIKQELFFYLILTYQPYFCIYTFVNDNPTLHYNNLAQMLKAAVGTFGSGKTRTVAEVLRTAPDAIAIVPNKALKMALLARLGGKTRTTVLTIDSFVHHCTRHLPGIDGSDFASKRKRFCQTPNVPPYLRQDYLNPRAIAVDDADRIPAPVVARIVQLARDLKVPFYCTLRDEAHLRRAKITIDSRVCLNSCVRCTPAVKELVGALFRPNRIAQGFRMRPHAAGLNLHAHAALSDDRRALACATAITATLTEEKTVILTNSKRLLHALETSLLDWVRQAPRQRSSHVFHTPKGFTDLAEQVVVCRPELFYGLERCRVILITDGLHDGDLLEGLTRATRQLDVWFNATAPPMRMSRVCHVLAPLLPHDCSFVDWESYEAIAPLSGTATPTSSAPTKALRTVRDVAHDVAENCLYDGTCDGALHELAVRYGWDCIPTSRVVTRHHHLPLPEVVAAHSLQKELGEAAELLFVRRLMLLEPMAVWIPDPPVVTALQRAIPTPCPEFLAAWKAAPYLFNRHQDEAAWRHQFNHARWGNRERRELLAARLAAQGPPHVIVDETLLTETVRAELQWATREYVDMSKQYVNSRALWLLAALTHTIEHGGNRLLPVMAMLDESEWQRATARDPSYIDLFPYMAERTDHFLQLIKAWCMQSQVYVHSTNPDVVGVCDFYVRTSASPLQEVVEIKASSGVWDDQWGMQAALYAHGLKAKRAHVFNVLNGEYREIRMGV